MAILRTSYDALPAFTTKDGTLVRELMHPAAHGVRRQSLAEARLPPGARSLLHRHREAEEVYHFLEGEGLMRLGEERFPVRAGDTVCIPPGTPHALENPGPGELRLLCACSPPYRHEDTELLEPASEAGP